jgi:hypothetical protein
MIRTTTLALIGFLVAQPTSAQTIRTLSLTAKDLVYSPLTGRIYASSPSTNSVVEVEPVTGTIGPSIPVGSEPNKLALSDTGEYLYVGLDGLPGVVRVHLPTRTVGTPFTLGNPGWPFGPRYAEDMVVLAGSPDVVAVSRHYLGLSPRHAGVAIYDNGVERSNATPGHTGANAIEPGAAASRLYGYNNETTEFGFRRLDVAPTGVTTVDTTQDLISGFNVDIEYQAGRLYSTTGVVLDPETRSIVTTIAGIPLGSLVEPAGSSLYYLLPDNSNWRLRVLDGSTYASRDVHPIDGVSGTPGSLIRWGANGLAFRTTANQVFLIRTDLLPTGVPTITITSPTTDPTFFSSGAAITLAGNAADTNGTIASIQWSSDRGYSGTGSGAAPWFASDIPLVRGTNTLTVTITDNDGLTASDTITVTLSYFSYYLAEGATGGFFDYDLLLANPSQVDASVLLTFFTKGGTPLIRSLLVPGMSRRTVRVDDVPGLEATTMSTSVGLAETPLVVERTMRWDDLGQYGAHTEKATGGAAEKWYFAEGSQGFFFTYLLLANPGNGTNSATVDWLIEGAPAVRRTYDLPAYSRVTIDAGADAALVGRSFGIVVTFAQPGVAERTMYFGAPPDTLFKGGHNSAGVNAPASSWFFAEGATGPFFETFILLANPNPSDVQATLTLLTQGGVSVVRTVTVPASARLTVNLEALSPAAPELSNAAVATTVQASLPIVAERAQYWPGLPQNWYEAHNSFGLTATARRWGLAEGRVGNPAGLPPAGYQTFVLLANPGGAGANVTLSFLRQQGAPVVKSFHVPAGQRHTITISGPSSHVPELQDESFGVVVDSDQPIAVERALYGNSGVQVFGIGTNATATRLP